MANFSQALSVIALSGIPNPSNPTISVNVTATGQSLPATIWGVSTGGFIDTNNGGASGGFAAAADPNVKSAMKSLNFQMMRWNALASAASTLWYQFVFGTTANSALSPDWTYMNNWFNNSPNFWNGKLIVGFGPNSADGNADSTYWTNVASGLAHKFISQGQEVFLWEFGNEPNGVFDMNTYCTLFNAVADTLHGINSNYQVTGPALAGFDSTWASTFANNCGSRAAFLNWHNYTNGGNGTGDAASMYNTAFGGTGVQTARSTVAGTPMANKPFFLGEYSTSYNCNDPMMQQIYGAVYAALFLQDGYDNDTAFQYGGIWDLYNDGNCGTMTGSVNIYPTAYYLSQAGQRMGGTKVSATSSLGGSTRITASVNGKNFGVQIINYGQSATGTFSIGFQNGQAISAKTWTISPSNPTGATSGALSSLSGFSVPDNSVMIIYGSLA